MAKTSTDTPRLGAHMSIVGGFDQAVVRAAEASCTCVQVFTTPPRIWPRAASADANGKSRGGSRTIEADEVARFQDTLVRMGVGHPLAHASYLINVASPNELLWHQSIDGLVVELQRAARLGIPYLVLHPGAYTTSSEEAGLQRAIQALREALRQTADLPVGCLLETTAGQGSQLGHRFEHLATILDGLQDERRAGVCLDTCHLFAAGYGLETPAEFRATLGELDRLLGLSAVRAIHLNDSKAPRGSRRDRHEHIGKGTLGLEPFRHVLHHRQLRKVPMYLETPKGMKGKQSWDVVNLRALRALLK